MSIEADCEAVMIVATIAATNPNKTRIPNPTSFSKTDFFVSPCPGRNMSTRNTSPYTAYYQYGE